MFSWKQFWLFCRGGCKHHWHKKEYGDHVEVIDEDKCTIKPVCYYKWTCCKCELKKYFPFSFDPNGPLRISA